MANFVIYQGQAIAPTLADLPNPTTTGLLGITTDTYSVYVYESSSGWTLVTGSGAPISSVNTNSIDTQIVSNIISSNLNLSSNSASSGNLLVNLDIESTGSVGLRAQLPSSSILAAISATAPVLYNNTTGVISIQSSNLTDTGTDGITITGGTAVLLGTVGASLSQHVADTSHNGYLSSTDWNTFNSKQVAGNYITALTGDVTASGPGSAAATLATVNSNIGTFASVTVNAKGLVTAAAALSGDATTSSSSLTLATVNTNTGSFGSSTSIPNFTVNGKGLITAAGGNAVIAPAGTLSGTTLNSTVVSSSLTSVGTLTTGTWDATTIAINHGGTGQTTANTALNALLPSQTGQNGNVLTTDGTNTSWEPSGGGGPSVLTWMSVDTSTTTPASSDTPIIFTNVNFDTASGYNVTNGQYTIPTTGIWQVNVELALAGTAYGGSAFMRTTLYKNGSILRQMGWNASANSNQVVNAGGATMEKFTAGDVLQIEAASNIGAALDGGAPKNFWSMGLIGI